VTLKLIYSNLFEDNELNIINILETEIVSAHCSLIKESESGCVYIHVAENSENQLSTNRKHGYQN